MSMCRIVSCVVGRGCLLWPVCSLGKTISLCPASFCTPSTNLPITPGVSWLPTFAFQSPIIKRTSFEGVLKGLVGLHRTIQLQLLQRYWLGHRLGLPCYWMVCLRNRDRYSILKSRDITLPTKICLVKAMVFPVVMYECESWTIKKAESWIIDAFELWCWRRLLRVPWTARRSNQSFLKEISPGKSLEGMML